MTGELYIGGDGVARGYLNRADLTQERFVRDRFSADPQARMYRTGDLGRWGEDGTLEFQGRNDFQVKIRGFRIELGEIEARLTACAGVREAVVLAREDVPGEKRLVAYWLAEVGAQVRAAELRLQLSAQLPEYMLPTALLMLEAFPLTPNGKLDRKALPAPDATSLMRREYEAPQGEIEQELAEIWQSLLSIEQVGRHDHFFELGGHSLLVVAMTTRLRAKGLRGEVRHLFAAPVLSAYAATLRRGEVEEAEAVPPSLLTPELQSISPELLPLVSLTQAEIDCVVATVPGGVANVQDIYPLLPSQQGILFHHMLDGEGDTYLLRALLAFDRREELDDFLRALNVVVARHDILRTAVVWEGLSTPVQVVYRQARVPVHELTLPGVGDALEELTGLSDPRSLRLDLTRAPLLAAYVAEDRAGGWMLSMLQHHLVCDHVTLALALAEIDAIRGGNGADLADEVPMRQLVAQALRVPAAAHEAYFRQELAHIDEPTAPFNVLDARQSGATFQTVGLPLDASLGRDIRAEARRRGVSPASLFHVAWAQVLARCTGRNEVVFGTVLSGRMHGAGGADRAWGMFINTLPIRVVVDGTAADAVDQTRRRLAELLEHEHAPLSLAQRCSSVPSSLPLFTTLLNCRHDGDLSAMPGGMRLLASEETTNYPISVDVDDFGDRFALTVQVVDGLDAARLAGYFAHTIESLTEELRRDGARSLHALDVLPPPERERVLSEFNATTVDYPRESLIHELFEQQAAAQPDAAAVAYEDHHLTYGELNARANQVAHYLLSQGVKPDDRVAICVERSLEMVVGLLGILKAGGAYVPLDPDYPAERLAYMLEDSAPVVLLTQATLEERLPVCGVPTLRWDTSEAQALLATQPTHNPDSRAHGLTSRHLAYVIYTSGSTGTPKGVMVEHASTMSFIAGHIRLCGLERCDRVLQFASFAFDSSIAEMMPTLSVGATLVLRPRHLSLDQFSGFLETQQISVVDLPTAFWGAWARWLAETPARSPGGALRLVIVSGESVELHHLHAWHANPNAQRCRWLNNYGPTEATVNATAFALDGAADIAGMGAVSIGRPVANAKVYLLSARGEPVPQGVAGELYIGGAGVARGYLNRPELTAERFVADPFSADPQARMYRTGDLGRWLPDGKIEFLGRNDFQVKIRGFRIELGEIEARLTACAGVREAVVLAREDVPGDKRLVAYVVQAAGAEPTVVRLREALQAQLPEYMVPSAFMVLDAFPLTPNGKLDRKALPAPDGSSLVQREYEAPQGEMEKTLARIWGELLGVEQVGRQDHFFELGGHSMLVMAMMEQLRTAGLRAEVRDIFAAPTLRECAAVLRRGSAITLVPPNLLMPATRVITPDLLPLVSLSQDEIDRIVDSVPGGVANIQDIYPLLPMQEGMLFHHLLQEHGDLYLARVMLAFDDRATLDELLIGLQAMIDRHEVLRSGFYWEGLSQPVQIIRRRAELSVHECAVGPGEDAEALLREQADPGKIRLDLRRAPLMHMEIVHDRANGRWLAALLHHHITCDHLTMERVLAELDDWRGGRLDPAPAPLFRNVVAEACLIPQDVHATFFRENLAGLEAPSAPFGLLDVQLQAHDLTTASLALDSELGAALRDAARQLRVPVSVLFHAAFALVVSRCSGRDDVVFGTVLSGRLQGADGRGEALGLHINTLPFRVQLDEGDARAFVHRCHQQLLELLAHEQAPLTLAQRISGLPASMPLLTSLLNFRHSLTEADAGLDWPGMRILESSGDEANFPLTAKVDDFGTDFDLRIDCHRDLDPQRLLGYFETALTALCGATVTPCAVKRLDVMPASERRTLVGEDHALPVYPSSAATLHELFELSAASRPDAVALVFEGESLSYRTLNEQANRLAHHLCALGVRPEARVAICLERGFAQVIALLAVLKAGAAYVPLDPGHPDGRLRDTVVDCEPSALITSLALATRFAADASLAVLCIDDETLHDALLRQPADNTTSTARADGLAYIIYTSGSTGRPKGVLVEHRQVLRLFASCESLFDFGHRDVWTLFHSFAFDFSVWEIWGALLYGGRLVIVPQAVARSADAFGALLRREQVTVLNQTPSAFWALLAAQEGNAGWSQSLRWVVFGGEAFDPGRLRSWFDQAGGRAARLINMYGITETTVHVTWQEIDASMLAQSLSPIGRPLPDLRVYLLDEAYRPVPWGAIGEIHVAGAGLARGYWRREALTAERFVPDPFAGGDNRMYRSGDLARLLPDGGLDYLGRNDFQVKVRGYRIELGEIETALLALPGVREAAVLARKEGVGDGLLVAYLTMASDASWTAEALREALAAQLPEHMLPGAFVPMDAFPLTVNGKLDRAALPPPGEGERAQRAYEAPLDGLESMLAEIWQELLELPRIGRNDDFFELGGHSLLAVRMVTQIGAQFGCTVPIQALFAHRTLKAFAGCVQQQQVLDTWREAMTATPADAELLEQEWTEL
ncbi:hypothetical protein ASE43_20875 [Lysobacter sp. Root983]|nr:hypothetical protein ASE43_20875 [Lysobacter sp. Root983]